MYAGFRLVMGSWKIMAMSFPRSLRRPAWLEAGELLLLEADGTGHPGDLGRQQSHDRERRDGLARTALTDQAERLPSMYREVGVLHDGKPLLPSEEFDPKAAGPGAAPASGSSAGVATSALPAGQPGQASTPAVPFAADEAASRPAAPDPASPAGRPPPG